MGACMVRDVKKESDGESTIILQNSSNDLKKNYSITSTSKILGAGAFGKVFLSHNIADPSLQVAIKFFNKTKLKREQVNRIRDEVKILTTLDHPNIVKYY